MLNVNELITRPSLNIRWLSSVTTSYCIGVSVSYLGIIYWILYVYFGFLSDTQCHTISKRFSGGIQFIYFSDKIAHILFY